MHLVLPVLVLLSHLIAIVAQVEVESLAVVFNDLGSLTAGSVMTEEHCAGILVVTSVHFLHHTDDLVLDLTATGTVVALVDKLQELLPYRFLTVLHAALVL